MQNANVLVLVATHNSEKYLSAQLDSILEQTHKNVSVLISDDNSTDSTMQIIDRYALKENVHVINSEAPLRSAQANFMFLLKNAPDADYYMFCDHDDVWLNEKIEKTLLKMRSVELSGMPALVHTDLFVADSRLGIISPSMFEMQKLSKHQQLSNALIQNSVTGCTVMINNPLRSLALKKTDTDNIIMHDWFLNILALSTGTVGFVDEPLILYRQHGNNEVGAKDASSATYIASKAFSGKKNKESLKKTFLQADMIAELYKDELKDNYQLIREYGNNLYRPKLKRLYSCIKHKFWKNTLLRRLGQILYI